MRWFRSPAVFVAFFVFALVPGSLLHAQSGPRSGQWAHANSSLPPDERIAWGRLENGFRYALLPHSGWPGRVALRLVVLSGSMDELPEEHGIAHFTEHMAFRGTKNFKGEDMVALFQRLGMEYGSDVNAVTTPDYTAYSLDYRETTSELLREGLQLFREFGDSITFDPAAIEKERHVILSEMRSRDSLAERNMQASYPIVFRGLQFAQRSGIGTEKALRSFQRADFVRFHERCYRPDLMILVATGDFDLGLMQTFVHETFREMKRPATPIPARNEGRLDTRGLRAGLFRMSGVGSAETMVASVLPPTNRPETREVQIERQRRGFVMRLLEERLRTRAPNVGGPQASYQSIMGYDAAIASVQVAGSEWAHGVLALDQIVRNTHRNGFERDEIETLRQRHLRMAQHMIDQVPTLDPVVLCDALTDSITNHTVFVGFEREFAWTKEWLGRLTAADVQQTFRSLWALDNLAFHVGGEVAQEVTPAEIVKRVQQYRRGSLSYLPPPLHKEGLTVLKPWGQPSEVAERKTVSELGAVLLRYGNNVRLNFVSSQQEPGLVRTVVRVGTGLLDMPGKQPALKEFGLNTLVASGTGRYRPEQLSRIVDERMLEFSFDVGDPDAFTFRGQMATEHLPDFLGVVAEFLDQPRFTHYAHTSARMQAFMTRSATEIGFEEGMRELTNHLFRGDARFMWGTPMDYISLSVVDVRRWMEPSIAHGYVEATVVGDISEEAAVAAVARSLGALKPRAVSKEGLQPAPAAVRAPAGFRRLEFVGEHNVAMVVGTWPVAEPLHLRDQAALEVLTKVLEIRIREQVRDNLGLAYSPSVTFNAYDGFERLALVQATTDCAPLEAERVAKVISEVGAKLAEEGVQSGEFIGSRGILASQFRRAFRQNGFLVATLMRAQEKPEALDEALELHRGLIDDITLDEVNSWAKRVLPASNSRTASLVPKAYIGVFDSQRP